MTESEKLLKLVSTCKKNYYKPDLHSFMIDTEEGRAYVIADIHEVFIQRIVGNDFHNELYKTAEDAANRLVELGAKYSTYSM